MRMVRHLFKAILAMELNRRRLGVHDKTHAANFLGDARNPVYRIEEHEFPQALSLACFGACQPAEPKCRHLFRESLPVRID